MSFGISEVWLCRFPAGDQTTDAESWTLPNGRAGTGRTLPPQMNAAIAGRGAGPTETRITIPGGSSCSSTTAFLSVGIGCLLHAPSQFWARSRRARSVARAQARRVPTPLPADKSLSDKEFGPLRHRPRGRGRPGKWTAGRVLSTQPLPLPVIWKVEPHQQQPVNGIAQQDFRERILAIGRSGELLHCDLGEVEQLVARERGLEFFELLFDPGFVPLARSLGHGGENGRTTMRAQAFFERTFTFRFTFTLTFTVAPFAQAVPACARQRQPERERERSFNI